MRQSTGRVDQINKSFKVSILMVLGFAYAGQALYHVLLSDDSQETGS